MNTLPKKFLVLAATAALALPLPSLADNMGGKECDYSAKQAAMAALSSAPEDSPGSVEPMSEVQDDGDEAEARMQLMEQRMREMAEASSDADAAQPGMGMMMGRMHSMGYDNRNCRMGKGKMRPGMGMMGMMQGRMMHKRLDMLEKRMDLIQTMLQMLVEQRRQGEAEPAGN